MPPAPSAAIAARLVTGLLNHPGGQNCQQVDGAVADARFAYLLGATVKNQALYLTESVHACESAAGAAGTAPNPRIRKVENGAVSTYLSLPQNFASGMQAPGMAIPQYASGVWVADDGDAWVTGVVAAASDGQYVVNMDAIPDLGGTGYQYVPGLYRYSAGAEFPAALVAGAFVPNGQPRPAVVDGQGAAAQFYAPHHLEVDANGVTYVIDNGLIRTVDASYNVKTLDLAERYGITPKDPDYGLPVTALNADQDGNVHALLDEISSVTWLNLATGKHVSFERPHGGDFVTGGEHLNHSIAAVGDALIVGNAVGHLFRVAGDGTVKQITSSASSAGTVTDETAALLQDITQTRLPSIAHLEYAADGTLYIVLASGVLAVDNFLQAVEGWAAR